jgi:hypothetical protein
MAETETTTHFLSELGQLLHDHRIEGCRTGSNCICEKVQILHNDAQRTAPAPRPETPGAEQHFTTWQDLAEKLRQELESAQRDVKQLEIQSEIDYQKIEELSEQLAAKDEALAKMIGWVNYAVECDPFYFSDEQAPSFKADMEIARGALKESHSDI